MTLLLGTQVYRPTPPRSSVTKSTNGTRLIGSKSKKSRLHSQSVLAKRPPTGSPTRSGSTSKTTWRMYFIMSLTRCPNSVWTNLAYTEPQEMLQVEAQTLQQVEKDQDKGLFMQTGQGSVQKIPARNQPPATEGEVPVYQQDPGRRPQGRLD